MASDVKWIKIATDIFDDEKIILLESMPEADALIVIWFKILALSGRVNTSGVLMINERIAYTEEMLANIFRRKLTVVRLALQTFQDLGMIEIINNVVTIPNWNKHQQLDSIDNKREYMREYMRERREKQKQLALGECKTNSKVNSKTNVNSVDILSNSKSSLSTSYFESKELNDIFLDFIKMRKTKIKNGAMTESAIKRMVNKINKYDEDVAYKMIENSLLNNWKDIYELKDETVKPKEETEQKIKGITYL